MANNNRVKQWCEKCQKKTIHETRLVNDEELLVCLKCYIEPKWDPNEILRNSNKMNMAEQIFLSQRGGR